MNLCVTEPFGEYAKGDIITDAEAIAAILASEQARFVVKIPAPDNSSAKA